MLRARALAIAALVLLSACGRAPAPHEAAAADGAATEFLARAAQHEAFQVAAARVAAVQADSAQTRVYAARIAQSHGTALAEIAAAARAQALPAPAGALDDNHQAYLDMMEEADPATFQTIYVSQQILLAQQTIAAGERYAAAAPSTPLARWARAQLPVWRADLEAARALAREE